MIDLQQIVRTNGYAIFHIDASVQNYQDSGFPDASRMNMLMLCEEGKAEIENDMQHVSIEKGF